MTGGICGDVSKTVVIHHKTKERMETPIGKRVVLSRRSIAQVTKKCLEVEATKNCNLTTKKGQSDLGIGVVGGV